MGFRANGNEIEFYDEKSNFNYKFSTDELMQAGIDLAKETTDEAVEKLQNFMTGLSFNMGKFGDELDTVTYYLDDIYQNLKPSSFEFLNTGALGWSEIGITLVNSIVNDYYLEAKSDGWLKVAEASASQIMSKVVSFSIFGAIMALGGETLGPLGVAFATEYANETGEKYNKFVA